MRVLAIILSILVVNTPVWAGQEGDLCIPYPPPSTEGSMANALIDCVKGLATRISQLRREWLFGPKAEAAAKKEESKRLTKLGINLAIEADGIYDGLPHRVQEQLILQSKAAGAALRRCLRSTKSICKDETAAVLHMSESLSVISGLIYGEGGVLASKPVSKIIVVKPHRRTH